jgi:hyperosmotically inducible protein
MKKTLLTMLLVVGASQVFAAERSNLQVFRDVEKQVTHYVYFTIFDSVHAALDEGVVTLTGRVTLPHKADAIAKRVSRVTGVTAVRNRIGVLPVSRFDDDLRLGMALALYAHPALSQYARGANPPIHVIVERGRVTIEGVVNNHSDRLIATQVARSFATFGVTNSLLTSAEAKQQLERL